jgi:hypothetical protein
LFAYIHDWHDHDQAIPGALRVNMFRSPTWPVTSAYEITVFIPSNGMLVSWSKNFLPALSAPMMDEKHLYRNASAAIAGTPLMIAGLHTVPAGRLRFCCAGPSAGSP